MSTTNDGTRVRVFGLGWREIHTLRMEQVLREYAQMPSDGTRDRAMLFQLLFKLGSGMDIEEATPIENFLKNGGPLPPRPAPAVEESTSMAVDVEDEDEWPEYNEEDFKNAHEEEEHQNDAATDEPVQDNDFAVQAPERHTDDDPAMDKTHLTPTQQQESPVNGDWDVPQETPVAATDSDSDSNEDEDMDGTPEGFNTYRPLPARHQDSAARRAHRRMTQRRAPLTSMHGDGGMEPDYYGEDNYDYNPRFRGTGFRVGDEGELTMPVPPAGPQIRRVDDWDGAPMPNRRNLGQDPYGAIVYGGGRVLGEAPTETPVTLTLAQGRDTGFNPEEEAPNMTNTSPEPGFQEALPALGGDEMFPGGRGGHLPAIPPMPPMPPMRRRMGRGGARPFPRGRMPNLRHRQVFGDPMDDWDEDDEEFFNRGHGRTFTGLGRRLGDPEEDAAVTMQARTRRGGLFDPFDHPHEDVDHRGLGNLPPGHPGLERLLARRAQRERPRQDLLGETTIENGEPLARQPTWPPVDMVECCLCADEFQPDDMAPEKIANDCVHQEQTPPLFVCKYCMQKHIETIVEEGKLHLLRCPLCPSMLTHENVKQYATKVVYNRYKYLYHISQENIVMCLSPTCNAGQVHPDPEANPKMTCNTCGFQTCAYHKFPWHDTLTCAEFDNSDAQIERLEQAEATAKLLTKDHTQICTNCHQGVTRTEGCDHMTCACGMEWCYICGVSYEHLKVVGDTGHGINCTYNPNRVVGGEGKREEAKRGMLTETLLGGKVSEELQKAREERNERVRKEMRPKVLEAAEKRAMELAAEAKAKEKARVKEGGVEKKRKLNMHAPWEEK